MMIRDRLTLVTVALLLASAPAKAQDAPKPTAPTAHAVSTITVSEGVQLEVLDWGGTGRPIVLLAGLGNTAHVFDEFAPRLTGSGHVIGITRRGFGASSAPETGYSVDRLGEDVLGVLNHLALARPVLIGHSIAGQELSYIATKDPARIGGLIYLDAAYRYAYMESETPPDLKELGAMPVPPTAPRPGTPDLASIAAFRRWSSRIQGFAVPEEELRFTRTIGEDGTVGGGKTPQIRTQAIVSGSRRFADIRVPALAIFASPHGLGPWTNDLPNDRSSLEAFAKFDEELTERQAASFERGVSGSIVVRLRNAGHYVFMTHEREVLAQIQPFLQTLR